MKKFLITSIVLIAAGLIMRFAHMPGAALTLIVGTFTLLIHSVLFGVKIFKTNKPRLFLHAGFAVWTTYLLFRIQYWYGSQYIYWIGIAITITWIITLVIQKESFKINQGIYIVYLFFSVYVSYVPSHTIYYLFNLNEFMYPSHRDSNYYAWDRYSWFLYVAGKYDEAKAANEKAIQAVNIAIEDGDDFASTWAPEILLHQENIALRNWTYCRKY